jgi:hypothetical protein
MRGQDFVSQLGSALSVPTWEWNYRAFALLLRQSLEVSILRMVQDLGVPSFHLRT